MSALYVRWDNNDRRDGACDQGDQPRAWIKGPALLHRILKPRFVVDGRIDDGLKVEGMLEQFAITEKGPPHTWFIVLKAWTLHHTRDGIN